MTKHSPVESRSGILSQTIPHFQSYRNRSCQKLIVLCTSNHFAFKLKVIAEAEVVENNSEIALRLRNFDGSSLAKRSSEPLQWLAKNVSKMKDNGMAVLAKVS